MFTFRKAIEELYRSPLYRHPSSFMWRQSLSVCSQFCEAVVASGLLTFEQMVSAACRYCLGVSKQHGVIYWQIDQEGRIHDGKVMYYQKDCHRDKHRKPTWVSFLLRRRDPFPNAPHETSHCFFGLHLLSVASVWDYESICLVEAEKTAVILSEHYPQYLWLAAGGLGELQVDKFRPLRGRQVILFPDTDPDGTAFRRWYDIAQEVMATPFWEDSPPIRVSPILELNATSEQKAAKIDLVEYLIEH